VSLPLRCGKRFGKISPRFLAESEKHWRLWRAYRSFLRCKSSWKQISLIATPEGIIGTCFHKMLWHLISRTFCFGWMDKVLAWFFERRPISLAEAYLRNAKYPRFSWPDVRDAWRDSAALWTISAKIEVEAELVVTTYRSIVLSNRSREKKGPFFNAHIWWIFGGGLVHRFWCVFFRVRTADNVRANVNKTVVMRLLSMGIKAKGHVPRFSKTSMPENRHISSTTCSEALTSISTLGDHSNCLGLQRIMYIGFGSAGFELAQTGWRHFLWSRGARFSFIKIHPKGTMGQHVQAE